MSSFKRCKKSLKNITKNTIFLGQSYMVSHRGHLTWDRGSIVTVGDRGSHTHKIQTPDLRGLAGMPVPRREIHYFDILP